ncbi:MAG: ribonuclease HII [Candidatus Gracilibacteria bacterium]
MRKTIHKFLPIDQFPVLTVGIDEAGRGPWAGPVTAAAVFMGDFILPGLNDSKKLSEKEREHLYEILIKHVTYGVGECSAEEIDTIGIRKATHTAMKRALDNLNLIPEFLLIDGKDNFIFNYSAKYIIKGDSAYEAIAAASVIAKVTRDRKMQEYAKLYPDYSFDLHKGYGTKKHQDALKKFHICDIHRKTYKPIKFIIDSSSKE